MKIFLWFMYIASFVTGVNFLVAASNYYAVTFFLI